MDVASAIHRASVAKGILVLTANIVLEDISAISAKSAATGTRARMADAYRIVPASVRLDGWARAAKQSKSATQDTLASCAMCSACGTQRVVGLGTAD